MTFQEFAESVRTRYLDFYRKNLVELKSTQPTCAYELLVKPNNAANPEPFSLLRLDAVYQEAGEFKVVRVAMDQEAPSSGPAFDIAGLAVSTGTLSWESTTLSFRSSKFGVGLLQAWLSKWIDDSEIRKPDDSGLSGVIHSIGWNHADPETGAWEITIDFGSAPVQSLLELLELLNSWGAREIYLDSRSDQA